MSANIEESRTSKLFSSEDAERKNHDLMMENQRLEGLNKQMAEQIQTLHKKLPKSGVQGKLSKSDESLKEKLENLLITNQQLTALVKEKQHEIDGLRESVNPDTRFTMSDNNIRFSLNSNENAIEALKIENTKLHKMLEDNNMTLFDQHKAISELQNKIDQASNVNHAFAINEKVEQILKIVVKKLAEENANRDTQYEERIHTLQAKIAESNKLNSIQDTMKSYWNSTTVSSPAFRSPGRDIKPN